MSILIAHTQRPLYGGDLCPSLASCLTPPSRARAPQSRDPEPGPVPDFLASPGETFAAEQMVTVIPSSSRVGQEGFQAHQSPPISSVSGLVSC